MSLINGKDKLMGQASMGLPDVSEAVMSFLQPVSISLISKDLIDGVLQEIYSTVDTKAVRIPLGAQSVAIKPEGQRTWRWSEIYALTNLIAKPDDLLFLNNVQYRVMEKYDYAEYGYVSYHCVQDYDNANPEI